MTPAATSPRTTQPRGPRSRSRSLAAALCAVFCASAAAAAPTPPPKQRIDPAATIPLAPLGYQSPTQETLLMRNSTLALHFVDADHILLTYNARSLLHRIPNDPPDDDDQQVTALLLDAPRNGGPETGKLLAWADWRLHDHGQYLWPLDKGRFLLRQGLELRLLAPLEHLHAPQPLASRLLMTMPNAPSFLQVSPDGRLLVLQMENRPPADPGPAGKPRMQIGSASLEKTYDIQFVDLNADAKTADDLDLRIIGEQRSAFPLEIPIVPAGYLESTKLAPDRWHVTFGPAIAGGKRSDLFDFISSCHPSLDFISGDEFLVGGCQQTPGLYSRGGYTTDGKELWRYDFPNPSVLETLKLSEDGSRFALGRILTNFPLADGQSFTPDIASAQEINVYDARTGDLVYRTKASPMQADGRNYALSPDGLRLAIVANGAVEIFNLPPIGAAPPKK